MCGHVECETVLHFDEVLNERNQLSKYRSGLLKYY